MAPHANAASRLLAKGRESAALLRGLLGQPASASLPHDAQDVADQILCCFDRAVAALHGHSAGAGATAGKRKSAVTPPRMPCKRRTRSSSGEMEVRVEKKCTIYDGFVWRKYGQKDILGCKFPRLYFRCSYRHELGCTARRQVQQSDGDPSVYIITSFGEHTCRGSDLDAAAAVEETTQAPFVISFVSRDAASMQRGCSPWQCSEEIDRALHRTPKRGEEELRAGILFSTEVEPILDSTSVSEQIGFSSDPDLLKPLEACSLWPLGGRWHDDPADSVSC